MIVAACAAVSGALSRNISPIVFTMSRISSSEMPSVGTP
jgi:hypothetical protein